jgi:hypothetical protein
MNKNIRLQVWSLGSPMSRFQLLTGAILATSSHDRRPESQKEGKRAIG